MIQVIVQKIVDRQIKDGSIDESEKAVYLYGYRMLLEFSINIVASTLIAVLLQAYAIVLAFTVAFLVIRGYVGGYHAKTSVGCFCFSAFTLVASVVSVEAMSVLIYGKYFFLLEGIIVPCLFIATPIPNVNKPITENERVYFNKKVKQIYIIELLLELVLLFLGRNVFALSILAVHIVLFIMVLLDMIQKLRTVRQNKFEN